MCEIYPPNTLLRHKIRFQQSFFYNSFVENQLRNQFLIKYFA